jgi:hypothetical protein
VGEDGEQDAVHVVEVGAQAGDRLESMIKRVERRLCSAKE